MNRLAIPFLLIAMSLTPWAHPEETPSTEPSTDISSADGSIAAILPPPHQWTPFGNERAEIHATSGVISLDIWSKSNSKATIEQFAQDVFASLGGPLNITSGPTRLTVNGRPAVRIEGLPPVGGKNVPGYREAVILEVVQKETRLAIVLARTPEKRLDHSRVAIESIAASVTLKSDKATTQPAHEP